MVHRHEVPEKKRFPAMILVVIVQNSRQMGERFVAARPLYQSSAKFSITLCPPGVPT